jgi:hypothetical protein
MNDTTKAAADALMKLADDMQYAFLMAVQRGRKDHHKAKTDQLRAAIEAAIERAVAAERKRCKDLCEAISDQYREREGLRYPEMRTDAETGAGECAAAIEALGTKEGEQP